jgi:hypothetical protein
MKTYVFQLEVEVPEDQDIQPRLKQVLDLVVQNLSTLRKPEGGPQINLTVIDLGWKANA